MPNPSASPKDGLILLSKYFKFGQIFLTLIKSEICSNIFGIFEHGQIYLTTSHIQHILKVVKADGLGISQKSKLNSIDKRTL